MVNATFKWIDENLKDSIDFVIWTGDSARHDNDEKLPRTVAEIENANELLVNKFVEVFGKEDNINDTDPTNDFTIPIVPTFGNNDILPHNILDPGPNRWTKSFLRIWRKFIPEEQRHGFERGGWFFVDVIPNELAVFNLNTLYFFSNNAAVDGCADKSEIGYEQMDWLRIQLQFVRERGMKAIIMGHVPPARTDTKRSWDETCWQKYTLWMLQYRDIVIGSMYGHMNIEHFMIQDSEDINENAIDGAVDAVGRTAFDDELNVQSLNSYLTQLQHQWSRLPFFEPKPASRKAKSEKKQKKQKKSKEQKFYDKIGGLWGERYSVTLVTASVVPNYFPNIRVIEYNITGLEKRRLSGASAISTFSPHGQASTDQSTPTDPYYGMDKKHPLPPSKSAPPGPAYSPQTFTWLGYTQYYANLTMINNDFSSIEDSSELLVGPERWHKGKHSGKVPSETRRTNKFVFQVEYDTRTDKLYALKDLTVRSWLELAGRIGKYRSCGMAVDKDVKKKQKKKEARKRRRAINKTWFAFVSRAFVGTRDEDELWDDFA